MWFQRIFLFVFKKKNAFPSAKDTGQPGSLFNHLLLRMPAGRSVLVGGMTDTLRLSGTPEVGPLWGSSTSALTSCYMLLQGCPLGTSTHQSPLIHPNGPGVPVSVTSWPSMPSTTSRLPSPIHSLSFLTPSCQFPLSGQDHTNSLQTNLFLPFLSVFLLLSTRI